MPLWMWKPVNAYEKQCVYDCLTKEVWTAAKTAWCERTPTTYTPCDRAKGMVATNGLLPLSFK